MKIIIPAREGSKGLPHKNRKLFKHTADIIPDELKGDVYVYTDDADIQIMAGQRKFNVINRSLEYASDFISTKDSLIDCMGDINTEDDEVIIMLYLTYPERTWEEVMDAYELYSMTNAPSLLCKKEIDVSPFLILKREGSFGGSQLFYHDLYRRQDYPDCFEISHYITMFRKETLHGLNNNMYNIDTIYIDIDKNTIDVDTKKDLDKLNE